MHLLSGVILLNKLIRYMYFRFFPFYLFICLYVRVAKYVFLNALNHLFVILLTLV